jgi:hypothetical protein
MSASDPKQTIADAPPQAGIKAPSPCAFPPYASRTRRYPWPSSHIHVDYYGDLVQVDELGRCREFNDDDYSYRRRPRYQGYDY